MLVPSAIVSVAGLLLACGFFLTIDPAAMAAFSVQELAVVSFARLIGPFATLSTIGLIYYALSAPIEAGMNRLIRARGLDDGIAGRVIGAAIALLLAVILLAQIGKQGYYIGLLEMLGGIMLLAGAAGTWRRRPRALPRRLKPLFWPVVVPLVGSLALLGFGEANLQEALIGRCARLGSDRAVTGHILMLGKDRILYRSPAGDVVLADLSSVLPIRFGQRCPVA